MTPLSVTEARKLLLDAADTTHDADTRKPTVGSFFTPATHRRALDLDATVVRGARGVGKTYWTELLADEGLRRLAAEEYQLNALRTVQVHTGYGSSSSESYPSKASLTSLLAAGVEPEHIWRAIVVACLEPDASSPAEGWVPRVDRVREDPDMVDAVLRRADRAATDRGDTVVLLFDALDQLHDERRQNDRLVVGLMKVALELRLRHRRLRAKVFVRADMDDNLRLAFADASKLRANAAELSWQPSELYGLLFHRMGNADSDLAARFRETNPPWVEVEVGRRHRPPTGLAGDPVPQRALFEQLAGEWMGANHRKGYTYPWLPNHLMDGKEHVSPRSFLGAVAEAAQITSVEYPSHDRALHHDAVRNGVQRASSTRVDEIEENMPWAAEAGRALAGLQVPMDQSSILERWEAADPSGMLRGGGVAAGLEFTGPKATTLPELIDELMQIGVMTRRADGRVDLPDIYRIAFAIGRKGGVRKLTASRTA